MSRYLCVQMEMDIMRINFEATEVALARARTPAGLSTSVLFDIAQLMEGNALGSGDRASKLRRLLLTWHEGQHTSCCLPKKILKKKYYAFQRSKWEPPKAAARSSVASSFTHFCKEGLQPSPTYPAAHQLISKRPAVARSCLLLFHPQLWSNPFMGFF